MEPNEKLNLIAYSEKVTVMIDACTGYIFKLSWRSKRPKNITLSLNMAVSSATQDALWLRQLLHEMLQPYL